MKPGCFTVALILALVSAAARAAELDEITIEVIDASASSVGDVMRNIEIPRYDRNAGRESVTRPPMPKAHANGGDAGPAERDHHKAEDHADDRRESADALHAEHRDDAAESHDEAREDIEEAHDEAADDHEDAHADTTEDIDDVEIEKPEEPEEQEDHEAPEEFEAPESPESPGH